jgi:hypothetical protein
MQPIRTFTDPVRLPNGPITLPRTYVYCSDKQQQYDTFARFADRFRSDSAWRYYDIPTGHNLMYSAVDDTVRILREIAEAN